MTNPNIALATLILTATFLSTSITTLAAPPGGAYTEAQAAAGEALYVQHCAHCHGADLEGGIAPALTGKEFANHWSGKARNVDDLFYILRTTMPRPDVGSLSIEEYTDLLAFTLARNGMKPGANPLDSNNLMGVKLPGAGLLARLSTPKLSYFTGKNGIKPTGTGPGAEELVDAANGTNWLYHTGNYQGTRYTTLDQINRSNVAGLRPACTYEMGGKGTFITGPVVYAGVMYLTTTQLTVAIDAVSCEERWRYSWEPQDEMLWPTNRGVAIKDGYVVRGTADGYLFALDAANGNLLWARQIARPAAGETITMAPLIFEDRILVAPAGSENNIQGWIGAFALADGSPLWRFNTVPKVGEPGAETWGNRDVLPMGGGAIWTPLSLDVPRGELYVPVTNPAPDFAAQLRGGKNLYTNAIVALDVRTGALRWYDQLVPSDDKDWDLTQVSPVYEASIAGQSRKLVATAGKDGVLRVLDRESGERIFETKLGVRINEDQPITVAGTRYCPGILGGVQWNGPSLYPPGNLLYVTMVNMCSTGKLAEDIRYIPGESYLGGTVEIDEESSGSLNAIDASTGEIRWQYDSEEPMVAATLTTAGGLVLVGELSGDLIAFNADTGKELFRHHTGGSMVGGLVSYAVDGTQYISAVSGRGSFWFGGEGEATVQVFRLGPE